MPKSDNARLNELPTATGGIARAAYVRASGQLDVEPLLRRAGLTVQQVKDPDLRIGVKAQISFLKSCSERIAGRISGLSACPTL